MLDALAKPQAATAKAVVVRILRSVIIVLFLKPLSLKFWDTSGLPQASCPLVAQGDNNRKNALGAIPFVKEYYGSIQTVYQYAYLYDPQREKRPWRPLQNYRNVTDWH